MLCGVDIYEHLKKILYRMDKVGQYCTRKLNAIENYTETKFSSKFSPSSFSDSSSVEISRKLNLLRILDEATRIKLTIESIKDNYESTVSIIQITYFNNHNKKSQW